MTPNAEPLVVGGAIVDHPTLPTRVLCAQRSAPAALDGLWELPGGKCEPGEDPRDALRRELREELGVEVILGAELPGPLEGDWPIPSATARDRRMRVFTATLAAGSPAPAPLQDHHELQWHGAATVESLPWLPADVPIAADLATRLRA